MLNMLVQNTFNYIKKEGFRLTKARKKILEFFLQDEKPANVNFLLKYLHGRNLKVNKTTVYREINFLIKLKLIQEVYIDPKIIYYESAYLKHHHHFICKNCRGLEDVYLDEELKFAEIKLEKEKKFKIERHSLEFFGLCANCR